MGTVIAFPVRPAPDATPARAPESSPAPRSTDPHPTSPRTTAPRPTLEHRSSDLLWREAVGHTLRTERHSQERTLADIAEHAGVSTQYLSEIERGRKEPSSEILAAVGGALGLRLLDLTSRVTHLLGTASASSPVLLAA